MPSLQRLSWSGLAIALSCSLLIEVARGIPFESLQPRKGVDANIACSPFGFPRAEAWPVNAPEPWSRYQSMLALCAKDQPLANVGCLCDSPWDRVECRPNLGDPVLHPRFRQLCLDTCVCLNKRGGAAHPGGPYRLTPPDAPRRQPPTEPFRGPNPFADMFAPARLPPTSGRVWDRVQ